jgi:dTDP-D-glucose 4,6-dehydratase
VCWQGELITYVEDRAFNDLRYTVNSEALSNLGWKEEVGESLLS